MTSGGRVGREKLPENLKNNRHPLIKILDWFCENSNFAWSSTFSEQSEQRVRWGMGSTSLQHGKKTLKKKACKDTLPDGAPQPL